MEARLSPAVESVVNSGIRLGLAGKEIVNSVMRGLIRPCVIRFDAPSVRAIGAKRGLSASPGIVGSTAKMAGSPGHLTSQAGEGRIRDSKAFRNT
jgi:hypothetical protein